MAEKNTGMVYVNLNGVRLACSFEKTINPGGPVRNAVITDAGVLGHAVMDFAAGKIELEVALTEQISLTALQGLRDQTALIEYDSGQRYMMTNAGTDGEVTQNGNKAKVTLTGQPFEEI